MAESRQKNSAFPIFFNKRHRVNFMIHNGCVRQQNEDGFGTGWTRIQLISRLEIRQPLRDHMAIIRNVYGELPVRIVRRKLRVPDTANDLHKFRPFVMPGATSEMHAQESATVLNKSGEIFARSRSWPGRLPVLE